MSNQKFINVITTKSLGINLEKAKTLEVPLYRVIALLSGAQVMSTNYGESIKFNGEIEVTVYETGEMVKGFAIYFPGVAEAVVNAALKEGSSIQIALEIGAKPSVYTVKEGEEPSTTAVGYEYTVKVLSELVESTALSEFTASLALPPIPSN